MEQNLMIPPEYLPQPPKQGSPTGTSPFRSLPKAATGIRVITLLVRFVNANVTQTA